MTQIVITVDGTQFTFTNTPLLGLTSPNGAVLDTEILALWQALANASGGGGISEIDTGTGLIGGPITSTGTISLGTTGVTPGIYGNDSLQTYPIITVNALGQLTSATLGTVSSGTGTVTSITAGSALLGGTITSSGTIDVHVDGVSIGINGYNELYAIGDGTGSVTNIATGTGLTGGPITDTGTISIGTTGVTAGTYGDGSNIPQVTVNALGQVTSAINIPVTGGGGVPLADVYSVASLRI